MEACGPLLADGVTPTPDANCNGIPGDGDYQLGSSCAKAVTIAGKSVRLFAASHPGTAAVHLCTTGCPVGDKLFNYVALSCGADTTDTVLGYATTTQLPKYAAVNITATSCVFDGGTYGPHWNIQVPAQTFYVLP
jgi:hypothetical protein